MRKKIVQAVTERDGIVLITADHGNVEEKLYRFTGEKRTNHTINPVPFYFISKSSQRAEPLPATEIVKHYKDVQGTIADVAPTILELFKLQPPAEMIGKSLLSKLK